MKKRFTLFLTTLLITLLSVSNIVFAAIPEPTEAFYANDFANVLESSTIEHIINKNIDLETRTGAQIVVATVDFADGMDLDDYSTELFNSWGIGSAELNNGYLILLFIGDDDYRLQPGMGLESVVPNRLASSLVDEHLDPYFDIGDYDSGVMQIFDAIYDVVDQHYIGVDNSAVPVPIEPVQSNPGNISGNSSTGGTDSIFSSILGLIIFVAIIALIIKLISRPRRNVYNAPYGGYYPPRRRTIIFFPWTWGRRHQPPYHPSGPPPGPAPKPQAPPSAQSVKPSKSTNGGLFSGGGGSSRAGSSVGRSSSSSVSKPKTTPSSKSTFGSSSRGGFGGSSSSHGMSRGGGGRSRGGGVGRKK